MDEPRRYIIDIENLPPRYPTHRHTAEFWEALGRAVATFGFLEETLGKAIFSFTATRSYPEDQIQVAYEKWLPTLERALSDQLGSLIDTYGKAVRDHGEATIQNLPELIEDLRAASVVRNVICHGSWGEPDMAGRSIPLFVNRRKEKFETPVDIDFLDHLQRHTVELACAVIDTVTHMGWQFPGSSGPGEPILKRP
jgi:hypothetical protein